MKDIDFSDKFKATSLRYSSDEMIAALYVHVNIVRKALILVIQSCNYFFINYKKFLLGNAFDFNEALVCIHDYDGFPSSVFGAF